MRISVVGTGYVGLVSGACLAEVGHDVICVDLSAARVDEVNAGRAPIHETGLDELLADVVGTRLRATTDLAAAVADTELTMLAVGTPDAPDGIDLTQIETASREIGEVLAGLDRYHVVVVKSTVVPGTTDGLVVTVLEEASGRRAGPDLGVGMNPEFLREGHAVADFRNPDRIVLGGIDARTIDTMARLYEPFEGVDIVRTTPRVAEMIKYTGNSLLATLVSFSNEIADICAAVGDVDVTEVMRGLHLDRRLSPVGPDGERVWPGILSYLAAGCGFGGSCLPKDVRALVSHGRRHGAPVRLLEVVEEVNRSRPAQLVDLVADGLGELEGRAVTVLGLAFKPDTDDVRYSPALPVVAGLVERGAVVTVHDPVARPTLPPGVRVADDLAGAVADAEAVILVTSWSDYAAVPKLLSGRAGPAPLVVDGRRMLDPASVDRYAGIGRS